MHETNIRGLDLNLLVILEQLLKQPTVSAAAVELGMSQPAASRALAKLRLMFDDPLLVPSGRTLVLTPRAKSLREPLDKLLKETRKLLGPSEFCPQTADFEFRLYTKDYESLVFLPALLQELSVAPNLRLEIPPMVSDFVRDLRDGHLDLIVGAVGELAADFRREHLFDERFVCVTRREHPEVKKKLDLKTFVKLSHIVITTTGAPGGPVDQLLEERGLKRKVGLRLPHFLAAPLAVAESDMILTLPARLAQKAAQWAPLDIWKPPIPLKDFSFSMIWHERNHSDEAHRWVRARVSDAARHINNDSP